MKKLCGFVLGLVVASSALLAIGAASVELGAFTVVMKHVNELVESFEQDAGTDIGRLSVGMGVEADIDVLSIGPATSVAVGGRALFSRQASRDIEVEASLLGLYARGRLAWGRLAVAVDVGGHRGAFSFAEARLVGLSGWGGGVGARVEYGLPVLDRFEVRASVGLRWLPVYEMKDVAGQKYRGRGTAFMDFSGIVASMALNW